MEYSSPRILEFVSVGVGMGSLDNFPSFLELGEWTTGHVRPLFEIFRDENVAPALALTIVAFALALCGLFALYTTYIRSQVRRRTRAVRKIKNKAEFAESMPRVERLMLRSRYLRLLGRSFEKP